jgi:hypothetical protein
VRAAAMSECSRWCRSILSCLSCDACTCVPGMLVRGPVSSACGELTLRREGRMHDTPASLDFRSRCGPSERLSDSAQETMYRRRIPRLLSAGSFPQRQGVATRPVRPAFRSRPRARSPQRGMFAEMGFDRNGVFCKRDIRRVDAGLGEGLARRAI